MKTHTEKILEEIENMEETIRCINSSISSGEGYVSDDDSIEMQRIDQILPIKQAQLKEAERHDRIMKKIKEKVLLIRKEEKVFPLTNTKESKERARLFNKLVDRITFRFAVEINKIDQEEDE
jgi:hypothetical protein